MRHFIGKDIYIQTLKIDSTMQDALTRTFISAVDFCYTAISHFVSEYERLQIYRVSALIFITTPLILDI